MRRLSRVYTPEQTLGVDALDKPGVGNDKTYLVGLEVSDEVPFYVGGEGGGFFHKFRGAAFSKYTLPRPICFHDSFGRMKFRHCHKGHSPWQCRSYLVDTLCYSVHFILRVIRCRQVLP